MFHEIVKGNPPKKKHIITHKYPLYRAYNQGFPIFRGYPLGSGAHLLAYPLMGYIAPKSNHKELNRPSPSALFGF